MTQAGLFDVDGRSVLVTGAASGIGRAIADAMAQAGARVTLADIDGEGAEGAAAALRGRGLSAEAVRLDVADRQGLHEAVDAVAARQGGLDAVFANAGISAGPSHVLSPRGRLDAVDPAAWDHAMQVNLGGAFETVRAAARHMIPKGAGSIVVTASISGMTASPVSGYAYVAAKAALINLVRHACTELGPHGVRINAVAPGFIVTNLAGGALGRDEALAAQLSERVPLRRVGRAEELQGVALFLASDASSYVTGTVIPVDGGVTAT